MALGALVALAGALRLGQYFFDFGFHIDQLLFRHKLLGTGFHPGNEMAPNTALCFVFCGLSLLLFDVETRRNFRPAQALILTVGLISWLALLGYSYRVLSLYRIGSAIPMAL